MARNALTPEKINSETTRTPTFTAANTDGHMAVNDGLTFLRVKNTDGTPKIVTVLIPKKIAGVSAANGGRQHTVPATTGDVIIGPFPPAYTQESDGRVYWDYSATTGVTVAVLQVEQGK